MNKLIRVELLSDMCPGSGDGFAGVVDTDVCYEENGLPYIPGKRLKGCLRECGLDIISVDDSYTDVFIRLFGKAESSDTAPTMGEMKIGNGRIENYESIVQSIAPDFHRTEISEVYTSKRTRTRIGDDGIAAKGSLRTARVLNKDDVYEFPITISDDEKLVDFLEMCVRSLRSIGLNRSRGLGEVKCRLKAAKDTANKTEFKIIETGAGDYQLSYILTNINPIITANRYGKINECEDYIFGSAVLGAFAARYIDEYGLDSKTAYRDNEFKRLFLENGLKFTAAMPYKDGLVYLPASNTLKTNKPADRYADESAGIIDETGKKDPICKKLGGYISIDSDGYISCYSPEKVVFTHHARPSDRAVAHAVEEISSDDEIVDKASSENAIYEGDMFAYEALAEGQMFSGSILGSKEDLEKLSDLFADDSTLYIGRSRTAQYGKVKLSASELQYTENKLKLQKDMEVRLRVITPLILEDKQGTITTNLNMLINEPGVEFEIIRSFCTETVVSGYYGKWMLPKPQCRAIAEGSVIILKYTGNDDRVMNINFLGKRNNEGYGQVLLEQIPVFDIYQKSKPKKIETIISEKQFETKLGKKIRELRDDKKAISEGGKYGASMRKVPSNSTLQRIAVAARDSKNFTEMANKILDIKQSTQQRLALSFVTGESDTYFRTDEKHLEILNIVELLNKKASNIFEDTTDDELFSNFAKYVLAAIVRIKQEKRNSTQGDTKYEQ